MADFHSMTSRKFGFVAFSLFTDMEMRVCRAISRSANTTVTEIDSQFDIVA
jgi:hypothetical protein